MDSTLAVAWLVELWKSSTKQYTGSKQYKSSRMAEKQYCTAKSSTSGNPTCASRRAFDKKKFNPIRSSIKNFLNPGSRGKMQYQYCLTSYCISKKVVSLCTCLSLDLFSLRASSRNSTLEGGIDLLGAYLAFCSNDIVSSFWVNINPFLSNIGAYSSICYSGLTLGHSPQCLS